MQMQGFSLKKKIILQMTAICLMLTSIAGLILYRNDQTANLYQTVTMDNFPKVVMLGDLMSKFRFIRIQVRSLGLVGNTASDNKKFSDATVVAIDDFLKAKDAFKKLPFDKRGEELYQKFDTSWAAFHEFGKQLLTLSLNGDDESLNKMTKMVRENCENKSNEVTLALEALIAYQTKESQSLVTEAMSSEKNTLHSALILIFIGFCLALSLGFFFANSIIKSLSENIQVLNEGASNIEEKSKIITDASNKISSAATQQAANLSQTVSSIDEISAMISRNASSASSSAQRSQQSTLAAQRGKEKTELMLSSINNISEGNREIINQMQRSNNEISEIVKVIQDIAQKTQVINDIVFQTKLLSFNASVEAARAGEHGKGFAVVAEEVGNLASMSGKAATEISEMLNNSTKKVTDIVASSRHLMENLMVQSKEKIDIGTNTARDCALALDEILDNVSAVNEMIKEISTASQEQSAGVREINTAMSELDHVTQTNSNVAKESSQTAKILKEQAEKLNHLVAGLTFLIEGQDGNKRSDTNVVSFELNRKTEKRKRVAA